MISRPAQPRPGSAARPSTFLEGELAPCEHLVQIYHEDGAVLNSLEGFVAGGLKAGEGVVVIATPSHVSELEERLRKRGISLTIARSRDQYIALDAGETISKFLIDGWLDEARFEKLVTRVIGRARGGGRQVRAFGEMVALLWSQGLHRATFDLENMWHALCRRENFSLLCAYPRSCFGSQAGTSIRKICAAHSRVVA